MRYSALRLSMHPTFVEWLVQDALVKAFESGCMLYQLRREANANHDPGDEDEER